MLESFLSQFQAMSYWEYIAVALGLAYVLLAIKQSLWCWPAAFVSTSIYTILFWQGLLYMESFLNFYYLLMAIYGWTQWRNVREDRIEQVEKPIVSWSLLTHLKWIAAATLVALLLGYIMNTFTDAKLAYLDTFTTVFAIMATYLVTQKVLENWLYWVVIDLASIYIYLQLNYLPTAGLFALYTVLAIQGYIVWRKEQHPGYKFASSL